MALVTDFRMTAGSDRRLRIAVKDSTGAAVQVDDARWVLALSSSGRVQIVKTVANGGVTITDQNVTRGLFYVDIGRADTLELDGTFYHDVRVTSGGKTAIVLRGKAQIDPTPLA